MPDSYIQVLREIDRLRERGVTNSDPEMMKLRIQLRDHLEKINKNKPKTVVPTLMSIKTVKLEPSATSKIIPLKDVVIALGEMKNDYAKYALLGVAIAIVAIVYKWYRRDD